MNALNPILSCLFCDFPIAITLSPRHPFSLSTAWLTSSYNDVMKYLLCRSISYVNREKPSLDSVVIRIYGSEVQHNRLWPSCPTLCQNLHDNAWKPKEVATHSMFNNLKILTVKSWSWSFLSCFFWVSTPTRNPYRCLLLHPLQSASTLNFHEQQHCPISLLMFIAKFPRKVSILTIFTSLIAIFSSTHTSQDLSLSFTDIPLFKVNMNLQYAKSNEQFPIFSSIGRRWIPCS